MAALSAGSRHLLALLAQAYEVPEACRPQQAKLVAIRIRALATVMAALTLLWIPLDAYGLTEQEFARIGLLRLGLAVALLWLARSTRRIRS